MKKVELNWNESGGKNIYQEIEKQNERKKEGGGIGQCPRNQLNKKAKYVSVNTVSSIDANKNVAYFKRIDLQPLNQLK
jgi:hypothetical protein